MTIRPATQRTLGLVGVLILLVTLFPLFYMGISSFKPESEIGAFPFRFFPQQWEPQNYSQLFEDGTYLRSLLMTFLGASIFSVGGIAINSMAAYAFARINFRGKKFLFTYVIVTMFIPFMSIFVTSYIVVFSLGMVNTLSVLIVPALAAGANVFFFRQFYLFFPRSLEEAAVIDGCTQFGIFVRIFLPNSLSIFVIIGIQRFMGYWNAYIWAVMTIVSERLRTVMQTLSYFRTDYGNNWGVIMAGSTIAAIPPLILLLVFQRYIIQGVKITGMK